MNALKKSWQWVVGVVGAVLGLLLLRNYFQKDLKAKAKTADTDLKSAVIDAKLEGNTNAQADLDRQAKELLERNKANQEAASKASDAEISNFWNKKK
jgi:hypothetical protein